MLTFGPSRWNSTGDAIIRCVYLFVPSCVFCGRNRAKGVYLLCEVEGRWRKRWGRVTPAGRVRLRAAGRQGASLGGRRKRREEEGETLHPGYLLGAREGVVEARHVGHDGLLVRTGRAHNVCGGGGGERQLEGVRGGFVKLEQQFDRTAQEDEPMAELSARRMRRRSFAVLEWEAVMSHVKSTKLWQLWRAQRSNTVRRPEPAASQRNKPLG